jgi:hypothetical protein
VLKTSAVAVRALKLGATEPFAFWLALADISQDESSPFHAYLAACPTEAPDPCSWSAEHRRLLDGTPLAAQVESQRSLLAAEYARIAPLAAPHIPYEIDGVGAVPSLLWARGVHMSRCFPRALVEAADLATQHEVLASDMVDEALRVELGGDSPARVHWPPAAAAAHSHPSREPTPAPDPHSQNLHAAAARDDGCPPTGIPAGARPASDGSVVPIGADTTGAPASFAAIPSAATELLSAAVFPATAVTPAALAPAGVGSHMGTADSLALAGTLGCLLPGLDMMDHQTGHPIGWEAGRGQVCIGREEIPLSRFRHLPLSRAYRPQTPATTPHSLHSPLRPSRRRCASAAGCTCVPAHPCTTTTGRRATGSCSSPMGLRSEV